ncbi:bifunctional DNA primase/polymerase [Methylobacterium sp. J-076]|uniref:bifunctional DNA primase/polymerase n=1 Tax=Methylobacterium sp. J-076 TaxID=2836655 RepID=UPI001FB86390|nr:bifunctional DNA primase/polymerase [Methylobacterium sp. J-076]MCJ2011237.1 bifunctional DNA primase/polymerase [Methylobacterium sp. J-076]
MLPAPPSGVEGLTPTQVRAQLARMGWTAALPIVAHDAAHTGAGKAPGIRAWQQRAQFEGPETTAADLADWQRKERQWPGTGVGCGNCIAIDADFATDPELAATVAALAVEVFGETPFVRQGQAPKVALIYRAAEPMPSVSLKTADGSGDGIDVLAEARQFVAYGVHRKTLKPYAWIGTESPLTAGPDEAPEITQAQVDDFLSRLRAIVELNGTGGRKGAGGGGGGQIVRDEAGKVIDGREIHLTRIVYSVALAKKSEGEELTVAGIAAAAWDRFVTTTILNDRWTPEAARAKAAALLDRVRRGFVSLDPAPLGETGETIEPTYPDRRVSVAEAEAATAAIVASFFGEHIPAWKRDLAQWKIEAEEAKEVGQPEPAKPTPASWGARVETAIGKTALAIKGAAEAANAGISIVYAAPMHSLLAELAARFATEGVEARVYRGYASDDPEAPGLKMCLDIDAMQDARDAVRPIPSTVCEKKIEGEKLFCRFHDRCGMERQRKANAPVWLVPHALLFQARPGAIPAPDALVIDEGIAMGALPDTPARMSLDAIQRAPVEPNENAPIFTNAANDLDAARAGLLRALRDHQDDGPLQRAIFLAHGVTATIAAEALKLEWGRLKDPGIAPGMEPKARKALAAVVSQHNRDAKALAGIWRELRAFLAGEADASGRLYLRYDEETEARILERRSLDTIRASWTAPALLIDATLPEARLLEPVVGHGIEVKADITARWSDAVKVRQIVGAPVTARKLGIIDNDEEPEGETPGAPKRVITDLLRFIHLRAALVWPRVVVVIAPMRLIAVLTDLGLPENVETAHFGAVAGIDRWASAAGLICIGRLQPGPGITEPLAGIITGTVPGSIEANAQGGRWYTREAGAIRLADGKGAAVERIRHPDALVEALRWQITEAGLIQAIGRLRALRRDAASPAFLDIINDVPLPISVGEVTTWDEVKVSAWAGMASEGVLLASPADIEACFPEEAPTRQAAREMTLPTLVVTSLRNITIDVTTNVRLASYKRLGRFAPARAILLPNAPADLQSWLFDRLGSIEWLKVEEPEAHKEAAPQLAPAAAPPRLPRCADYDPELAARYPLAAEREPEPFKLAPVNPEIVRWRPPSPPRRPVLRVVAMEAAE